MKLRPTALAARRPSSAARQDDPEQRREPTGIASRRPAAQRAAAFRPDQRANHDAAGRRQDPPPSPRRTAAQHAPMPVEAPFRGRSGAAMPSPAAVISQAGAGHDTGEERRQPDRERPNVAAAPLQQPSPATPSRPRHRNQRKMEHRRAMRERPAGFRHPERSVTSPERPQRAYQQHSSAPVAHARVHARDRHGLGRRATAAGSSLARRRSGGRAWRTRAKARVELGLGSNSGHRQSVK